MVVVAFKRLTAGFSLFLLLAGQSALAVDSLPELVRAGKRDAAIAMIEQGADVNSTAADGTTALHWASHQSDSELVELLLDKGADAARANDYGMTPLSAAAVTGDYDVIEALLDAGANVESPNPEGQTALMVVARTGQTDTAELLIDHGANVNAREQWGEQTALMWASAQQHPEMIELLVRHGADVDARSKNHDWKRRVTREPRIKVMYNGGLTPLLYAAREGCAACVEALVDGGADIDLSDPWGMTPLLMALLNFHFDTAAVLIEQGADINRWDFWGRTPLYLAIHLNQVPSGSRRGDLPSLDQKTGLDIAATLLERGAYVDMRLKKEPPFRDDPGDRATLESTADAQVLGAGATPLHAAAKAGDWQAVELLLKHGAKVDIPNVGYGITPILAAAGVGHIIGTFLDMPVVGRFKTSEDAIHVIELLTAAGADLNATSADGQTVAHGAAEWGFTGVLQYLHDQGVKLDTPDNEGRTPRDLAQARTREETLALLNSLLGPSANPPVVSN